MIGSTCMTDSGGDVYPCDCGIGSARVTAKLVLARRDPANGNAAGQATISLILALPDLCGLLAYLGSVVAQQETET